VFFAIISVTSFSLWSIYGWIVPLGIGVGVFIYGVAYFIIHDLFIHQRIKIWRNTNNRYLKAIRRAHKMHHKHLGKQEGECFGMLWVPMKYYKQEYSKPK
jgi:beta-carotene 3-hydroxylase